MILFLFRLMPKYSFKKVTQTISIEDFDVDEEENDEDYYPKKKVRNLGYDNYLQDRQNLINIT